MVALIFAAAALFQSAGTNTGREGRGASRTVSAFFLLWPPAAARVWQPRMRAPLASRGRVLVLCCFFCCWAVAATSGAGTCDCGSGSSGGSGAPTPLHNVEQVLRKATAARTASQQSGDADAMDNGPKEIRCVPSGPTAGKEAEVQLRRGLRRGTYHPRRSSRIVGMLPLCAHYSPLPPRTPSGCMQSASIVPPPRRFALRTSRKTNVTRCVVLRAARSSPLPYRPPPVARCKQTGV